LYPIIQSPYFRKRVRTFLFIALLLCITIGAHGQTIQLSDSLRTVFLEKPKLTASFNTWNSFVTGKSARIRDVRAGLIWKKSLSIGIGYHWLKTSFPVNVTHRGKRQEAEIEFHYWAPFVKYRFFNKKKWDASVDLQLGAGNSFARIGRGDSRIVLLQNRVWLYEASMSVEYKILNLIAIGGGYGYRIMLKNNNDLNQQFTSPVYVLGIRLIFDELYKIVQNKRSLRAQEDE
jgi:hypothetical protein